MDAMFYECSNLETLDLSSFNTSSVTSFSYIMGSNQTTFDGMLEGNSKLHTIYASNSFTVNSPAVTNDMFSGCSVLKGGQNTSYNSSNTNGSYAHIDGGSSNPGYFTAVE